MFPYLPVFGLQLPTYWLLGMIGMAAAGVYVFLTNHRLKKGKIPTDDLVHIGILAIVGALVGAKVLSIITMIPAIVQNWALLSADPRLLAGVLINGMVYYGGFIGAFLAVYLYCRKYKISFGDTLALITPAVPLFHLFGRVGCFLAGCCWGIEVPWGIEYPQPVSAPAGVPLLPVQLIEAACNLVLFLVLALLVRRLSRPVFVFPLYLLLYGVLRFVLEFFRGDALRGVALLSTSQWISLGLVALAVFIYFFFGRRDRTLRPGTP